MIEKLISILRWSEKYTKTDMVYLTKNSFWLNANNVITSIFAFGLSIAFSNYLSKETYGNYQFLISISSILATLTLTGMNAAVTQAVARGFEGVFKTSVRVQIKYALLPFITGICFSTYYLISNNKELSISILIISILLPITNAVNTWTAFLNGKKDFKNQFTYSQIINIGYYTGMFVCIIFFPNTVLLVATSFLINTLTNTFVYYKVIKKHKPNELNEGEAIEYGKKLSISSALPLISLSIDNIIIFHFLGATDLAIYSFASNIPDKFMSLIRPISTLAFPKFSEKGVLDKGELLSKITKFFIAAIIFAFLYILIAPIVFKIFFPNYSDSILFSQIYVIAAAISSTASLAVVSIFATRSNKIYTYNIINPIFNIGTIFIGAYMFGIWGVIFGKIIGNTFSLFCGYFLGRN